jgi:hypothetical protein
MASWSALPVSPQFQAISSYVSVVTRLGEFTKAYEKAAA